MRLNILAVASCHSIGACFHFDSHSKFDNCILQGMLLATSMKMARHLTTKLHFRFRLINHQPVMFQWIIFRLTQTGLFYMCNWPAINSTNSLYLSIRILHASVTGLWTINLAEIDWRTSEHVSLVETLERVRVSGALIDRKPVNVVIVRFIKAAAEENE